MRSDAPPPPPLGVENVKIRENSEKILGPLGKELLKRKVKKLDFSPFFGPL